MADLPKTYKACIYDQPGKVSTKVVELDMPEPGPGEVLINLLARPMPCLTANPATANMGIARTLAFATLTLVL